MKTKAIWITAALALTLAGAASAASDLWLHVKVDEGREGGSKVRVNVPISVVRKALAAVPDKEMRNGKIVLKDEEITVAELREMWAAVQDSPDATFVTVDGPEENVRVAKDGRYLVVRTDERGNRRDGWGSQVDVRVPVTVVEALLSSGGEELDLVAAIEALARHGEGELVTVTDDQDTVRVWVDRSAESR